MHQVFQHVDFFSYYEHSTITVVSNCFNCTERHGSDGMAVGLRCVGVCVHVCVWHRMGDSSQGWLRLYLRLACLYAQIPISCAVRDRGGVWSGPSAHYPVNLQALYITASAWQVLEHYKLSWQTLCARLLSSSLPRPLIYVKGRNREKKWERGKETITFSASLPVSLSHTLVFMSQHCPVVLFLDACLIRKPVNLGAKVK